MKSYSTLFTDRESMIRLDVSRNDSNNNNNNNNLIELDINY